MKAPKKITFLALVMLMVTGCKNFMNGGDLIKQIDNLIEYENAAYATVVVAADMDFVKEIQPSNGTYDKTYKKSDTVKVSVTEKKEYVFLYWSVEPAKSVKFLNSGDEKDKEIQLKILNDEEQITIKPVCAKRPDVSITPDYRSEGVAKNTSIIVSFSTAMDLTQEDIALIKIESAGIDYSEYYEAGVLSEDKKQITFAAKRSNLIPNFGGVKEVKVTIPETFSYKASNSFNVPFSGTQELYFRLNNQTIERITVTGKDVYGKGTLKKDGNSTLNYDDKITFSFEPNEEYYVNGWFVQDSNGKNITETCMEREISEDKHTITLYFRAVASDTQEIVVMPDVVARKKLVVNYAGEHAKITPTESESFYQDDSFTIGCQEEKAYCFMGWKVYDKENKLLSNYADYIKIEDPLSQNTKVTVIQAGYEITLKPELIKRPVATFAPEMSKEGVAKNSSITITFDKAMTLTQKELKQIKIECGGIDYSEYFNSAELRADKKQITYTAKRNKLIPSFMDTKVIEVTIPQTFTYNAGTEKDKIEIPFYEDQVFTYRIKDQTTSVITITKGDYSYQMGELVQEGKGFLNFDDKVSFYFTPNKAYYIDGWLFKKENGEDADLSPTCVSQEISSDKSKITLTFKEALSGIDKILVIPDVKSKEKFLVDTKSDYATLIPNEQKTYYKGDTFTIDCREEADWFFIGWRVYFKDGAEITGIKKTNPETENSYYEYSDVLTVDNPFTQNTTVTVLKEGVKITFEPELAIRPNVVSATPLYDSNGVYKDRRISVMFDQKLDKDCIYFKPEEIPAGCVPVGNVSAGRIYAYKKENDNSSLVYKAFKITKLNNANINLLEYYGEPTFDDGNTGVLKLGANIEEEKTPPASTDILVTVNKDIGYSVTRSDGVKILVPLSKGYKWAYYTNQDSDTVAPQIPEIEIRLIKSGDVTQYSALLTESDPNINGESSVLDKEVFETYNATKEKIWVKAKVTDGGSGPESLTAKIYRYTGEEYKNIYPVGEGIQEDVPVITRKMKLTVEGQNGETYTEITNNGTKTINKNGCRIDLVDAENPLNSLPEEGIYYIRLVAEDKNANEGKFGVTIDGVFEEKLFYFVWDKQTPSLPTAIKETRKAAASTQFEWKNPPETDWKEIKITATDITDPENPITLPNTFSYTNKTTCNPTVIFNGLTDQHKYEYKIQTCDYVGHSVETTIAVDNTAPKISDGIEHRKEQTATSLNWKNPTDLDFSKVTITTTDITEDSRLSVGDTKTTPITGTYQKGDTLVAASGSNPAIECKESTQVNNYVVSGLAYKHKYSHTITAYDWSGNSESVVIKDDVAPAKRKNVSEIRNYTDQTDLSWNHEDDISLNPENYAYCEVERYLDSDTGFGNRLSTTHSENTESVTITGLTDGKRYTYKIYSCDYSGNRSEPFIWTQPKSKPNITFTGLNYKDGKVIFSMKSTTKYAHPSITYKKTYNDTEAPRTADCNNQVVKTDQSDIEIPLYRNGHQYTFNVKLKDYDGNVGDPIEIKTDTYIIENSAQGGTIGQFVLFGDIIDYTGMVDVLTEPTAFHTYSNSTESINQLFESLAQDICDGQHEETRAAIIEKQKAKMTDEQKQAITNENEYVLLNLKSQLNKNGFKGDNKYSKEPGAFTNARTGDVNGTITLQPYQIAKFETTETLGFRVEYDKINNPHDNYTAQDNNNPKVQGAFFLPCLVCNKLSIFYGYQPCYTLYDIGTNTPKPVEEWCLGWKWDNKDETKKINKFSNFDNNLVCDFSKNGFRLPTELEHECAARGGSQTRFITKAIDDKDSSKTKDCDMYGWFLQYPTTVAYSSSRENNYDNGAERAGRYNGSSKGGVIGNNSTVPNYLGIYQISGNAWEWNWDATKNAEYSNETLYGRKSDNPIDAQNTSLSGPFSYTERRIINGGYWGDNANKLRVYYRHSVAGNSNLDNVGYRLTRTLGIPEQEQY